MREERLLLAEIIDSESKVVQVWFWTLLILTLTQTNRDRKTQRVHLLLRLNTHSSLIQLLHRLKV